MYILQIINNFFILGSNLVLKAIRAMIADEADEVFINSKKKKIA